MTSPLRFKIAVVEDDEWFGKTLKHRLSMNPDFDVQLYTTGLSLRNDLSRKFDLFFVDLRLPDTTGSKLVDIIQKDYPSSDIIVISAQDEIQLVVDLLKKGVLDYLVKDENVLEKAWLAATQSFKHQQSKRAPAKTKKTSDGPTLIGKSPQMQNVNALLAKAARTTITVSVTGETGTGKEIVARSVHDLSDRSSKPFVAVNVAAIPSELIESELFGYEKGAFTGATGRRIGKFEEANGGTLFLDEIGEMEISMQAKLLRVLQEKEVIRVGGSEKVPLDIRIIVATHKNLSSEVEKKTFREDLFYRLLGLTIELPPLRERGSDVEVLAAHFVLEFCKSNGIPEKVLSDDALRKLRRHKFPGNVRELKAVAELGAAISESEKEIGSEDIVFEKGNLRILDDDEDLTLEEYNRKIIMHFLRKYNHRVVFVAEKLGVGKSTIYNLLKEQGMKNKLVESKYE
jgi:hypothetical protein